MPNVSFLLKKPSSSGKSLIYLQFKYNGNRLLYSTSQSIHPNNWSRERQRVKNNAATLKDGQFYINDLLSSLEQTLLYAYRKELCDGIPTVSTLKKYLDKFLLTNINKEAEETKRETIHDLINRFINNEILYKGTRKSESTIKYYKTTYRHLLDFEKSYKYHISFDSITLDFFYKFITFLRDKKLQQNTLNKIIGVIKVWMSEGVDMGLTDNMDFKKKKFAIGQRLVETVYLKEEEILSLYHLNLSASPTLENTRDAFMIACYTGLRFSDFSTLKSSHIQNIGGQKFIKKTTIKTGEEVIISLNDVVLEIIEKYENTAKKLPIVACNPVFNKQIKSVCKMAELVEKGRLSNTEKELWELVSTHTARRSFATNAWLARINTLDIMRMTGHKSEKAFMRYIRLSKLDAAKRFNAQLNQGQGRLKSV